MKAALSWPEAAATPIPIPNFSPRPRVSVSPRPRVFTYRVERIPQQVHQHPTHLLRHHRYRPDIRRQIAFELVGCAIGAAMVERLGHSGYGRVQITAVAKPENACNSTHLLPPVAFASTHVWAKSTTI